MSEHVHRAERDQRQPGEGAIPAHAELIDEDRSHRDPEYGRRTGTHEVDRSVQAQIQRTEAGSRIKLTLCTEELGEAAAGSSTVSWPNTSSIASCSPNVSSTRNGAPWSMKMGNIASLRRDEAAARRALQLASVRHPTILRIVEAHAVCDNYCFLPTKSRSCRSARSKPRSSAPRTKAKPLFEATIASACRPYSVISRLGWSAR